MRRLLVLCSDGVRLTSWGVPYRARGESILSVRRVYDYELVRTPVGRHLRYGLSSPFGAPSVRQRRPQRRR